MKRPLQAAFFTAGVVTAGLGAAAFAQDSPGLGFGTAPPLVDPVDPALDPAAPAIDPSAPLIDPPASALPSGTPAIDPAAPARGNQVPGVDPAEDPSVDSAVPVPPARMRPGRLPPSRPPATGTIPPEVIPASPATAGRAARPATPGTDLDDANGQGAPLVGDEEAVPGAAGRPAVTGLGAGAMPDEGLFPGDGLLPGRGPLPDRGLPADDGAFPGGPLPAGSGRPAAPAVDPGYGPPVRTRRANRSDVPQVSLDEVVRNPVRVYDARLKALTGDWPGAIQATDTLLERFPNDPRVPYLRYFAFARSGQHDMALDALRNAITLEETQPVGDYGRFLEPFQGPDRFYLERVRRAAGELDSLGSLTIESPDASPRPPIPTPPQPAPPRPVTPAPFGGFDAGEPST